jgi:uncharacterized protein
MAKAASIRIAGFVSAAGALVTGAVLLTLAPMAQAGSGKHRFASGDAAGVSQIIGRAEHGDARAQAMLGFMYANGHGVPQSYDAAVNWYLQSAEQGDPEGQYLLGLMYDKGLGVHIDVIKAYKWLNLAAAHAPRQRQETFLNMRNAVASKMTPAQIEIGQRLALDFIPARQ